MKAILTNFALFVVLALAFSSFSACDRGTSSASVDNTTGQPSPLNINANAVKTNGSAYPPLAANLAQTDVEALDGSKFKIADRKGKVLLVNLWATWCGPCREEMPELVAMYEKHKENGFQVIGLDVGDGDGGQESIPSIKSFSEKMKLSYELARASNDMNRDFQKLTGFGGIPQSFLIDREGRLRGVFTGGGPKVIGQMKENVDKLMAE